MGICFKLVAVMAALCHNITFHKQKAEKGYEILTWVKKYSEEGILLFSSHQLYFVYTQVDLALFLCVAILIVAHI